MNEGEVGSLIDEISDLELIFWVEEEFSMRGIARKSGAKVSKPYVTFKELYDAVLELGPLIHTSPLVDVVFFAVSGTYDGHIVAVRQSGRNIRRFLIRKDSFDEQYGTFANCLNQIRSNKALDCELELKHLCQMADKLNISPSEIDHQREYTRLEVDVTAAIQLLHLAGLFDEKNDGYSIEFELGYCVGRLFSSAQNYATLEPDARRAAEYEESYRKRGKKGKSRARKIERLDHLFECISDLVEGNPALSRLKPLEVAKLALEDAVRQNPSLWKQGKGQLEQYLTCYASEEKYRQAYRNLFPKTG